MTFPGSLIYKMSETEFELGFSQLQAIWNEENLSPPGAEGHRRATTGERKTPGFHDPIFTLTTCTGEALKYHPAPPRSYGKQTGIQGPLPLAWPLQFYPLHPWQAMHRTCSTRLTLLAEVRVRIRAQRRTPTVALYTTNPGKEGYSECRG